MLEKIKLWWIYDGRYLHRDFITGVKNLWNWFPVIWSDEFIADSGLRWRSCDVLVIRNDLGQKTK